jgi:hypothetical protein
MLFSFEERPSESAFVDRIWRTQSERTGIFTSFASAYWEMVVSRHDGKTTLTVRGPETVATPAACSMPDGEWLGIVFKPGMFMPHLPPGRVADRRDADLPEATKRSFWLHGSTWEYPTFENADSLVDALVRAGLLVHDPIVNAVLQGHPHGLSIRSVQYRFLRATGLTHQIYQQIERARQAVTLLEQGASIADAVYEAGYFDQPHLTRSLKRFMGQTPTQIARAS